MAKNPQPSKGGLGGAPADIRQHIYWYSEDLKVCLVLKHNDPRTGEQTVGITSVGRGEPDPSLFVIPPSYKVVDETPVE